MSATIHDPSNTSDILQSDEPACRLYLISPPQIELRSFYTQLEEALNADQPGDAGIIGCFQLRLKDVSEDIIQGAAETLLPLLKDRDIPFLINDNPRIAAAVGADGVHIGQDDTSYEETRSIVGDDAIVGVTCHTSRHMAIIAAEKGADYVTFGAFFPSTSELESDQAEPELVRWWCDTTIVQCVANGGLRVDNCTDAVSAGADFLGVSGGIWHFKDGPGAAVQAFGEVISHTPRQDPVI